MFPTHSFTTESVLDLQNMAATLDSAVPFAYRVGLYANGWYDDGGMKGSKGTRSMWFDEIAIGTTYADVDPGQWRSRVERGLLDEPY